MLIIVQASKIINSLLKLQGHEAANFNKRATYKKVFEQQLFSGILISLLWWWIKRNQAIVKNK